MSDRPRCLDAAVAVAAVLEQRTYARREVLGVVEGAAADPDDWFCVVLARTHDEEWQVYVCWPDGEDPAAGQYDMRVAAGGLIERGWVVREMTNALSHGDALLHLLGYATGVLE